MIWDEHLPVESTIIHIETISRNGNHPCILSNNSHSNYSSSTMPLYASAGFFFLTSTWWYKFVIQVLKWVIYWSYIPCRAVFAKVVNSFGSVWILFWNRKDGNNKNVSPSAEFSLKWSQRRISLSVSLWLWDTSFCKC